MPICYRSDPTVFRRILILARPVAEARSTAIDEIEHIVRGEMANLLQAGYFRMAATELAAPSRRAGAPPARDAKTRSRRHASARASG